MLKKHNDDDLNNRLSLTDLRTIKKYQDVSDEEGEIIINDALALARIILDILD